MVLPTPGGETSRVLWNMPPSHSLSSTRAAAPGTALATRMAREEIWRTLRTCPPSITALPHTPMRCPPATVKKPLTIWACAVWVEARVAISSTRSTSSAVTASSAPGTGASPSGYTAVMGRPTRSRSSSALAISARARHSAGPRSRGGSRAAPSR